MYGDLDGTPFSLAQTGVMTVVLGGQPIAGLFASNSSPTAPWRANPAHRHVTAGTNVTYTWDFETERWADDPMVSHTYVADGHYTATVTAQNVFGSVQRLPPLPWAVRRWRSTTRITACRV